MSANPILSCQGATPKLLFPYLAIFFYETEGSSLFVTGHSLGAALAHLTAAGIITKLGLAPIIYTFSGPRAGDPGFGSSYINSGLQTWRIFNTEDIVPVLPISSNQLGSTSPTSIFLNVLIRGLPAGFSHIGYPVGVTLVLCTASFFRINAEGRNGRRTKTIAVVPAFR